MSTRRPYGAPTIGDIASRANVSRSTVSRAFSQPHLISPATVDLVKQVAEALGYVPNQAARALSTGRSGNIAVIVPDIANPFFPPILRAVQSVADGCGFNIFLGDSDEDPARELRLIRSLANQVEGFVLASPRGAAEQILLESESRPLVAINRDIAGVPRVLIDPTPGLAEAVDHLVRLGHRSVVYVSGPSASWSDQQRRVALERAAREFQVEIVAIAAERASFEAGCCVAPRVRATGATAAITFDDFVAHGLLSGLAAHGMQVPRDFSVVGIDDLLGASTFPALTSVAARCDEAGRLAGELLMGVLRGERPGVRHASRPDVRSVLGTHLVVRATTGPAALAKV